MFAFGGQRPSYVDFLLFNAVDVCNFVYGPKRASVALGKSPRAVACCAALQKNAAVAKALALEFVLYSSVSAEGKMPFNQKS